MPPVDPARYLLYLFQFPVRIDCFRVGDKSSQIKAEDGSSSDEEFW